MVPQPEQGGELQKRQQSPERLPEGVTERVAELDRAGGKIKVHHNRLKDVLSGVLDGLQDVGEVTTPVVVDEDTRIESIKAQAAEIALNRGQTRD